MTPDRDRPSLRQSSGAMTSPNSFLLKLAPLVLGLVTFLTFLPAVRCDFVNWDDDAYVYENPLVRAGLSRATAAQAVDSIVCHHWAPLTILSYQLDMSLFGLSPAGFHLTNVLLHSLSAVVLCAAVTRMTGDPARSAAATAFFALHPLRVESVAWISERKDVLAVLWLGLSLLAYAAYCRRPSTIRLVVVVITMATGLLAKATLVTLPLLLLLVDTWPLQRADWGKGGAMRALGGSPLRRLHWVRLAAEKMPLFILAGAFAVATLLAQHRAIQAEDRMPLFTMRIPNAIHAVGWYLWKTVLPFDLMALYRHPREAGWPLTAMLGSIVSIAIVGWIGWALRRRVPAVPVGLAWFLVGLFPVLGIVAQAGSQAHADRCVYISHIGLSWAIVWAGAWLCERSRVPPRTVGLLWLAMMAWFIVLDRQQIRVWNDSETLWRNVLRHDPESPVACNNLGIHLHVTGRDQEAIPFLERAVAGPRPDRRFLHNLEVVRKSLEQARHDRAEADSGEASR